MLTWQSGPAGFGWGTAAVAGACLAWGLDNNLTRTLSSTDPVQIAAVKSSVAGVANTSLALLGGVLPPSLASMTGAMAIGLLGYGASLVLFVLALRHHLGTARTAAYFSSAPFIGATLAVLMLGEPILAQLLAAGALMALGVYLHVSERHDHEHAHEAMEHEHRHEHDQHHRHRHEAAGSQPHSHRHRHSPLIHAHPHYPDPHHRHGH